MDLGKKVFLMNHYTTGVIMSGNRERMARQRLSKVNFENYEAIISFFNTGVHWKLLYLYAPSQKVFVVDPMGSDEMGDSTAAAKRFRDFFKMRRNVLGKEDWLNINWHPSVIGHTRQADASSCGVFVMQMGADIINNFPDIPTYIEINSSAKEMRKLREDLSIRILEASAPLQDMCLMCGETPVRQTNWIQCDSCENWFHELCISKEEYESAKNEVTWICTFCQPQFGTVDE
ncbi:uncharacterized protein [Lepisosteus oculatus]